MLLFKTTFSTRVQEELCIHLASWKWVNLESKMKNFDFSSNPSNRTGRFFWEQWSKNNLKFQWNSMFLLALEFCTSYVFGRNVVWDFLHSRISHKILLSLTKPGCESGELFVKLFKYPSENDIMKRKKMDREIYS